MTFEQQLLALMVNALKSILFGIVVVMIMLLAKLFLKNHGTKSKSL